MGQGIGKNDEKQLRYKGWDQLKHLKQEYRGGIETG